MTKERAKKAREELRKWAVKNTGGCDIQGDDKNGWPCGTCFTALLERIGLNPDKPEYRERGEEANRTNEVWRAILQIREAKI